MKLKVIDLNDTVAKWFILLIFILIAFSEYIFTYLNASYGILLSLALAIMIYLIISLVNMNQMYINAGESLALIPLYILFTSSLPWFFIDQQLLMPAVYSIILALCFWHMNQNHISTEEVGFKKNNFVKYILIGSLVGLFTGPIEYLVLKPDPMFPVFELKNLLKDFIYMTFFVGIGEELLFRGLIQNDLVKIFGLRQGILGQGFLFGIMHMTWRSPLEIVFTFFAGLLFGIIYHKTGTLTAPIMFHGVNNTVLVSILPYYFSGLLILRF